MDGQTDKEMQTVPELPVYWSDALTSGAGPAKAMTSWMLSVSFVSTMRPILPVCIAVGAALLLLSAAAHLTAGRLCLAELHLCA